MEPNRIAETGPVYRYAGGILSGKVGIPCDWCVDHFTFEQILRDEGPNRVNFLHEDCRERMLQEAVEKGLVW